jgi:urease gamma subunit
MEVVLYGSASSSVKAMVKGTQLNRPESQAVKAKGPIARLGIEGRRGGDRFEERMAVTCHSLTQVG